MSKQYLMKFKDGIDELKKDAILNGNDVINFMSSFGIYVILLSDEVMFSLRKDEDILYVKQSMVKELEPA